VPRLPHWPAPAARSSGSLTGARESSGGTQYASLLPAAVRCPISLMTLLVMVRLKVALTPRLLFPPKMLRTSE